MNEENQWDDRIKALKAKEQIIKLFMYYNAGNICKVVGLNLLYVLMHSLIFTATVILHDFWHKINNATLTI